MSPKRWISLLIFYISYLIFGASIYYHIEHSEEKLQRADNLKKRIKITEYLLTQLSCKNASKQHEILSQISDYCGRPVTDYRDDEYEEPFTWTFYHSIFFAFTVCSTVGYGNISPTTTLGRMIMIAYSVIGIPINSILFAGLADYFGRIFRAIYHRYKKYKMSNDIHYVPPQLSLITTVVIALIPGITIFLVIPSWVFSYFENWPFTLAFYYSYVTTTTIGFGDYVPTFQPHQHREFGNWFVVYQIFIIVWFIFSLGYFLMIMTFITRGLQSNKLAKLEQQLSANIRATQHRIWSGVTKDVSYLRKIFNELYFMKFKPVYTDLNDKHCMFRSISCPDLTIYNTELTTIINNQQQHRQRTFSQCSDLLETTIHDLNSYKIIPSNEFIKYSYSDTELHKIDRQKSFETVEAFRQTTQLLVKVVNALGAIKPPTNTINDENNIYTWNSQMAENSSYIGGYHGLSDSQILASEWLSFSNKNSNEMPIKRNRACSDFNLAPKFSKMARVHQRGVGMHNEWTWSGDNNQIQEEINIRYRQDNQHIVAIGEGTPDIKITINNEQKSKTTKKFTLPESFRRLFDFRKRTSQVYDLPFTTGISNNWTTNLQQQQLQEPHNNRKYSVVSVPDAIPHQVPNLSYYSTVTANASPTYFSNEKPNSQTPKSFGTRLSSMSNTSPFSLGKGYRTLDNSNDSKFLSNPLYQQRSSPINNYAGNELRSLAAFNSCRQRAIQELAVDKELYIESPPTELLARDRDIVDATRKTFESMEYGRRSSLTSLTKSQDHLDLLEKTTLADVIRALESVHIQATLGNACDEVADRNFKQQQQFPYRLAIDSNLIRQFPDDNSKTFTANSASLLNRMYTRRSTLLDLPSLGGSRKRSSSNILNRRQQQQQQPISTNLSPEVNLNIPRDSMATSSFRFKRRFSIRPTALQIPPGKAPRPSTILASSSSESNQNLEQQRQVLAKSTPPTILTTSVPPQQQQQSIQRYFTPRPSPLAQKPNISSGEERKTDSSTTCVSNTPTGSSSYSPLTRFVQITQAQKQSDKMSAEIENNDLK